MANGVAETTACARDVTETPSKGNDVSAMGRGARDNGGEAPEASGGRTATTSLPSLMSSDSAVSQRRCDKATGPHGWLGRDDWSWRGIDGGDGSRRR